MHLSFYKEDFKEFVDILTVALKQIDVSESSICHIHPAVLRDVASLEAGAHPGERGT